LGFFYTLGCIAPIGIPGQTDDRVATLVETAHSARVNQAPHAAALSVREYAGAAASVSG
jgi:hypothetical protein